MYLNTSKILIVYLTLFYLVGSVSLNRLKISKYQIFNYQIIKITSPKYYLAMLNY